jgi:hypothetical protein
MKPSPVQLLQSSIEKISVEVNSEFAEASKSDSMGDEVAFEVMERCEPITDYWTEKNPAPSPGLAERTFFVSLGIRTDSGLKSKAPYQFEIVCSGVVACIVPRIHKMEPDEAARQYGLAMIYGAMREQLLLITSRMVHGARLLPTVSFMESPRAMKAELDLPADLVPGHRLSDTTRLPNSH